jgi:tetratricopeptide (TPR) repeat protein
VADILSLEQQAIDFAKRGDFGPDAKRANEELAERAPTNQGAWTRLARCCLELGQFDEAMAAIDAALQLNPQNTIARNLQGEVTRRRSPARGPQGAKAATRTRSTSTSRRRAPTERAAAGGFGRAEFMGLAHLSPSAAADALGPRIESLLMATNDRPFAAKVVEVRNRAGRPGSRLFRRNSFYAGDTGHVYAFHHGGRWEPQINIGFFAASRWKHDCVRAGIGFNLSPSGTDPDREAGQERAMAHFERFQQLVASAWRQLLTDWMATNGGFIQYADNPPALELMPRDAVAWLINSRDVGELGWIFCGRWLFLDRAEHAETLGDPARLVRWIDQTFTDLLPLWTSVYRGQTV